MPVSSRHILEQGATFTALGKVAYSALHNQGRPASPSQLPGPVISATFPPRSPQLVREYVRHVGGDPGAYKGILPAHLFAQWGLGLGGQVLMDLPYPLTRALNGGCNLDICAQLPADEPLQVTARLQSIDDDGRRAVLQQRIVTGTQSVPEALIADMFVVVPLGGREESKAGAASSKAGAASSKPKEKPRVPHDVQELTFFQLGSHAGLDFAKLTGDFNPVHWVPPYARMFGFRSVILHGFGTMARAIEGVIRGLFAGDVRRLSGWESRFTRPLVLPARVGLYVRGQEVFVGDAPGGPAYLVGRYASKDETRSEP